MRQSNCHSDDLQCNFVALWTGMQTPVINWWYLGIQPLGIKTILLRQLEVVEMWNGNGNTCILR